MRRFRFAVPALATGLITSLVWGQTVVEIGQEAYFRVFDEGTSQSDQISEINCAGAGVACTTAGSRATITVAAGGGVVAGDALVLTGSTLDVVGSGADDGLTIAANSIAVDWEATGADLATVNAGDAAATGTQGQAARSDHQHPVSTGVAVTSGLANAEGAAAALARSDHTHDQAADSVGSAEIADLAIVNADVNANAAIAVSKTAATGGAGVAITGDAFSTASDEADFFRRGVALTCGAGTGGRGRITGTELLICDDSATPTVRTLVDTNSTQTITGKTLAAASNVIDADTSIALAADPADCGANTFATTIAASGALTCSTVPDAALASNYSGVGACTNQFARTLNDNAAPTCASVANADLAGGSYTGITTVGALTVLEVTGEISANGGIGRSSAGTLAVGTDAETTAIAFGNGTISIIGTGARFLLGRDANAGDSTGTSELAAGNRTASHGTISLVYTNAAVTGSPIGTVSFQPRNNAGTAAINPANLIFTKTAGADTATAELVTSTGSILINADGTVDVSDRLDANAGVDVATGNVAIAAGIVSAISTTANLLENNTDTDGVTDVLEVRRRRSSATAPGAGFGGQVAFTLEAFTNNAMVAAGGVRVSWEGAQANDTTDRDSQLQLLTMLDGAAAVVATISSAGALTLPGAALFNGPVTLGNAAGDAITSTGDHSFSNMMRLPRIENTAPAEPFACGATRTGADVYVDDTNDGSMGHTCVCKAMTDSTYDWRTRDDVDLVTGELNACPFF